VRIGVIGCGYWGSKHVRVFQGLPGVSGIVVVDPHPGRRAALSQSFDSLKAYSRLDAAIEEADAFVVATPPRTHAQIAEQLIQAGKHVLVEKPLAMSSREGQDVIDAARAAGVKLMVGHTFEYNAAVWKLRELISTGGLGELHYLDAARLNLGLYQQDINVIWDLAPHDISIINYLLGITPASVQAWGSSHAHAYLEDVAHLRLEYPEINVTAQIHVSWLYPLKVRQVTAVGSLQMAVYDDQLQEERIRIYDKGVARPQPATAPVDRVTSAIETESLHEVPMSYRNGSIVSPYIPFEEPLTVQDRHFLRCIAENRQPLTHGGNGLAVIHVLEAAEESLREGQAIALPPLYLDTELQPAGR
jgi:predicted dehydrogenase